MAFLTIYNRDLGVKVVLNEGAKSGDCDGFSEHPNCRGSVPKLRPPQGPYSYR